MKIINIKLNDNLSLKKIDELQVPSGNLNTILVNYDVTDMSDQLSGLKLMGTFKRQDSYESYNVELEDNTIDEYAYPSSCYIPYEVLTKSGCINVGFYAYNVDKDNNVIARLSCSPIIIEVSNGSFNDKLGDTQVPDITKYEEFANKVSTLKEETITDFTNYYEEKKATLKGDKGDRGEKGEKGDTGSIKFIIVSELPTEDIDDTAIYLLPTGDSDNAYDEYIFVDGEFEPLGQTQIEVDLTDYVKNTDYATTTKGGVVKTYSQYSGYNPISINSNGTLVLEGADKNNIPNRKKGWTVATYPILLKDIDEMVKGALTDGIGTAYTNEEQASARTRIGAISNTELNNALDQRIGTIETALQNLNDGEGVE